MAQTVKQKIHEPEDEFDVARRGYNLEPVNLDSSRVSNVTLTGSNNPKTLVISIRINDNERDKMVERSKGLLVAGGFAANQIESEVRGSTLSITVNDVGADAIVKATRALATDASKGKGDFHYALIESATASLISTQEAALLITQTTGKAPPQGGITRS